MTRRTVYGIAALAAIAALAILSCGGPKDPVVARVGDREITLGDFNIAYKDITVFNRPPMVTYEDAESFLQALINKEILLQEAIARGLGEGPQLERRRHNWLMEQSIRALYKEVSEEDLEITLAEVEDYYRRSRVKVRARQILFATLPAAEEVRSELEEGGDFATLARQHTIDEESRAIGGDMGTISHGQLSPPLDRAVFNLEQGEISEPIRDTAGFHILQVEERIEPSMDDFEDERHACAAELRSRKRNENWSAYLSEVEAKLDVTFNEENVNTFNDMLPPREKIEESDWYDNVDDAFRARVLATSAAGTYTIGDFLDQYGPDAGGGLFRTDDADMIRKVSEAAITNEWLFQEAQKRGLDKMDTVVRTVERKTEEQLLDLLHEDLVKDVTVGDDEVRALYEERKDDLIMPARARLKIINRTDRKSAQEAYAKLRSGVPFQQVSDEYNEGALRELGGDMSLRQKSTIPRELHPFAFENPRVGSLSGVIPHAQGYFVALLAEYDPEHPMSYEEAEPKLRQELVRMAQDAHFSEWVKNKREEMDVEIFPDVLNLIIEEAEAADTTEES